MQALSPRPLNGTDLELPLNPEWFPFQTTDEVPPLTELVGQPRAVRALEVGLGVRGGGYNIAAVGLSGTNLPRLLRDFIAVHVANQPTPSDWVYVNNFDEPDRPIALALPAGLGVRFRRDLQQLPQRLARILPRALQYQGFNQEKERLRLDYDQRSLELFAQLQEFAAQRGLHVEASPEGQLIFSLIRDGSPLSPEQLAALSPEEAEQFSSQQLELLQEAGPLLTQQQTLALELNQNIERIERTLAEAILLPLFDPLWDRYPGEKVHNWLDRVRLHMLDNLALFFGSANAPPPPHPTPPPPGGGGQGGGGAPTAEPTPPPTAPELDYEVNVVVDNSGRQGPPVLFEDVPTHKNLFGFIERVVDPGGRVVTHFTQIKAGALLRGNGGCVVFNIDDAIEEPLVWKELKRTLKNRRVHIETYDPMMPLATSGLKPEPIPLEVKVVVVCSGALFYGLSMGDPEFAELFKVKAEFVHEMPLGAESCMYYARLVRLLGQREGIRAFETPAVQELVRYGARLVADRRQVSADFSRVAGLIREANYWREKTGAARVTAEHVRQAVEEQVYRSNWFAMQTLRLVEEGSLLIEPAGQAVGRVNSLTVVSLGDYNFGQPMRLTASAWVGQTGVINIERESRLSGRIHDKGMLIMEGYLRSKYAQQGPIGLGASIAFEQSYVGVDGDSASAAELFCLVSALAGLPLRQDVGVTGSVNQHGQIQSIGGINEKIEGFFDVCRLRGLTGEQGVCFPRANVPNLVLRPDVREAVAQSQFHLWAIETLDEGLELLTGLSAGNVSDAESVHGRVAGRFERIGQAMRETPPTPLERATLPPGPAAPPNPPAPPTLPPHGQAGR
ncbi:MAG: AAA family ATPase [Gemmataceae bacterium]|nr:AAA family ATPase [Gemmataceae bacterium]